MRDLLIEHLEQFKGKSLIYHIDNKFLHSAGRVENFHYEIKYNTMYFYEGGENKKHVLTIALDYIADVSEEISDGDYFFVFFDDRSSIHLQFV